MNKLFILALFAALPAHADITYIQETYPGSSIMTGRGYITTPIGPNYTRVTPMRNGVVDISRPGYVIGPTLGQDVDGDTGLTRSLDLADERRKQGRPNLD